MQTKIIELRDEGTMMIVLGIKFRDLSFWDEKALWRAGYSGREEGREWYVVLVPLDGGVDTAKSDPWSWLDEGRGRTLFEAHHWLRDEPGAWDSLPQDGALIDVRVILGERDTPAESEVEP